MVKIKLKKKWSNQEILEITTQLYDLINSGIPILDTLEIISNQHWGWKKEQLNKIINSIQKGQPLAKSFQTTQFPPLFISLIGLSQIHGKVAETLKLISEWYKRKLTIEKEMKQKLSYPIFIVVLLIILFFYLLFFLLPRFQDMFMTFQIDLPPSTVALFTLITFVNQQGNIIIMLSVIMFLFLLFGYMMLKKTKHLIPFLLRLPFIKSILQVRYTLLFSSQLGLLLQSGMGILNALGEIRNNSHDRNLHGYFIEIESHVLRGLPLSKLDLEADIFHPDFYRLISLGERQGTLGSHLIMCSKLMEKRIEAWIGNWFKWMEPVLIITVGLMIGFIVFTLFLPIMQLIQGL